MENLIIGRVELSELTRLKISSRCQFLTDGAPILYISKKSLKLVEVHYVNDCENNNFVLKDTNDNLNMLSYDDRYDGRLYRLKVKGDLTSYLLNYSDVRNIVNRLLDEFEDLSPKHKKESLQKLINDFGLKFQMLKPKMNVVRIYKDKNWQAFKADWPEKEIKSVKVEKNKTNQIKSVRIPLSDFENSDAPKSLVVAKSKKDNIRFDLLVLLDIHLKLKSFENVTNTIDQLISDGKLTTIKGELKLTDAGMLFIKNSIKEINDEYILSR